MTKGYMLDLEIIVLQNEEKRLEEKGMHYFDPYNASLWTILVCYFKNRHMRKRRKVRRKLQEVYRERLQSDCSSK